MCSYSAYGRNETEHGKVAYTGENAIKTKLNYIPIKNRWTNPSLNRFPSQGTP